MIQNAHQGSCHSSDRIELSTFGENHLLYSHFRGVQSNYEATGNAFILFQYPSMNSNCNNLKIQK